MRADERPTDPSDAAPEGLDRSPREASPASSPEVGSPPIPPLPAHDGQAQRPDAPSQAPAADAVTPPLGQPKHRGLPFGRVRKPRKVRAHPYRDEASTDAEKALDPKRVALLWGGVAAVLVLGGYLVASRYSPHVPSADAPLAPWQWDVVLQVPLFTGIALLGASFFKGPWARRLAQTGWLVGALYGGLWAQDLFYENAADYVNAVFSLLFGVLFVYLAYHEWLSRLRRVENAAVKFLGVAWFVGAGAYFLIDKVQPIRLWLIGVVSEHTKWMLDLFGQGDRAGLVFLVDEADNKSPTTFFYPDQYCDPYNPLIPDVSAWCAERGINVPIHTPDIGPGFWDQVLYFAPDGDLYIKPVSIILACTALQSIMVFVGLFAGTVAPVARKLWASLVVGVIIYILNLVRNTGIIWFYGQGHISFWMIHDAIGKGGSLIAMIGIAFGVFRWFPEFFTALTGVLDLVDRDGPLERFLKLGRRRPEGTTATVPTPT